MKRLASAATAALFAFGAAIGSVAAEELRFDNVIVLGDSLSDSGSFTGISPVIDRDGVGNTYAVGLADAFGLTLTPNVIDGAPNGGTNYAQAGAQIGTPIDADPFTPLPLTEQGRQLLDVDRPGGLSGNDLVIVWGGANDVNAFLNAGVALQRAGGTLAALQAAGAPAAAIQDAAIAAGQAQADFDAAQGVIAAAPGELAALINELADAGATNLIAVTVPDVTLTPEFQASLIGLDEATRAGAIAQAQGVVEQFNSSWRAAIGNRASVIDSTATVKHLRDNAARYGLVSSSPIATACPGVLATEQRGCDATGLSDEQRAEIFADGIHPSAKLHDTFAKMAAGTLEGLSQLGSMPPAIMTALRQHSNGLEGRLTLASMFTRDEAGETVKRPTGEYEIYGGAEFGHFSSDTQQVLPGFDSRTRIFKIAADTLVAPNVLVGAGLTLDNGLTTFEDNKGGFDTHLLIGGVFGVVEIMRGFYANGFIGGGLIDVYNIERNVAVNAVTESYESETTGTYFAAKAGLGALLPLGGGFVVNPHVGFTFERVSLDGFSEDAVGASAPSLAGNVGDMDYEGQRGTVGLAGFYRPPTSPEWVFQMRGTYEHDFADDDVIIPFATTGPLKEQAAPRPDDQFFMLSGAIQRQIDEESSLSFLGSTLLGMDGSSAFTFGLVYNHAF